MPVFPEDYFVRVTDDLKPKREYTIPASTFDKDVHKKVDKPATSADGTPLPPKHAPEALSSQSGQKATTQKESSS